METATYDSSSTILTSFSKNSFFVPAYNRNLWELIGKWVHFCLSPNFVMHYQDVCVNDAKNVKKMFSQTLYSLLLIHQNSCIVRFFFLNSKGGFLKHFPVLYKLCSLSCLGNATASCLSLLLVQQLIARAESGLFVNERETLQHCKEE